MMAPIVSVLIARWPLPTIGTRPRLEQMTLRIAGA